MKRFLLLLTLIGLWGYKTLANNIQITNVSLTGQNTTAGVNNAANFTMVQFSVSWENSHRVAYGPNNWDAAWLFVKYRVAGGVWQHASLNNTGHTAPAGSTIAVGLVNPLAAFAATTNPGVGAFIFRSTTGSGTFTATNVQLRWNYGSNAVPDNAVVEVQVYGIEMIHVPAGAFNAGGGGGTNAFTSTTINTANVATAPAGTGTLGGQAGGYPTGQTAPTSSTWPNGFNAFYCMKYEISQQQYVDFLNNLTATQATARYNISTANRYGISVANGIYSTSNPNLACNFLSWWDLAAYFDWSGLRPMTELEYEKACRGTLAAVTNEFAWGTTAVTGATGLTNAGLANEVASNAGANASFGNIAAINGPVRVGMFAGSATTRAQSGATFYGIMEMSGNVWERCISIANPEGRAFSGNHGDGVLATTGESNVLLWPASTALGTRIKGGAWNTSSNLLVVSDRTDFADLSSRTLNTGGRGVRTAP